MKVLTQLGIAAMLAALAIPAVAQSQNNDIHARLKRQHMRIEQGVHSGHLSKMQAHRLTRRDRSIRMAMRGDLAHNNGRLTHAQRMHLVHRLNRTSRVIHQAKHGAMAH